MHQPGGVAAWSSRTPARVAYYLAYTTYLVLDASGPAAFAPFSAAMAWFVLPLAALTLAVVTWRASGRGLGRRP